MFNTHAQLIAAHLIEFDWHDAVYTWRRLGEHGPEEQTLKAVIAYLAKNKSTKNADNAVKHLQCAVAGTKLSHLNVKQMLDIERAVEAAVWVTETEVAMPPFEEEWELV